MIISCANERVFSCTPQMSQDLKQPTNDKQSQNYSSNSTDLLDKVNTLQDGILVNIEILVNVDSYVFLGFVVFFLGKAKIINCGH